MKRVSLSLASVVVLTPLFAVVVLAVAFIYVEVRSSMRSREYDRIEAGMTEAEVQQEMGRPGEIEPCRNSGRVKPCKQTYWYFSFMERWGISLDDDNRVLDKTYNVSY